MCDDNSLKWLLILMRINNLNRSVKESVWNSEDKAAVYDLKDEIIGKILDQRPAELTVELFYVPYYRYSFASKDRAGSLMRRDGSRHPFEYYLAQIELSPEDREEPDRATVEVVVGCMGETFSFHQPLAWFAARGTDISGLPRKTWINPADFNHAQLQRIKSEIDSALESLQ